MEPTPLARSRVLAGAAHLDRWTTLVGCCCLVAASGVPAFGRLRQRHAPRRWLRHRVSRYSPRQREASERKHFRRARGSLPRTRARWGGERRRPQAGMPIGAFRAG